jgi:hypothetical protein
VSLKHATTADDAAFQTALRQRRLNVPSAATVLASQLHEQLGVLSELVTKLARGADGGDEACDRELIDIYADLHDSIVGARDALETVR